MAQAKKKTAAPVAAPSGGLMDALDGIVGEMGIKDSRAFRPVPTGIDVLDFYNARYFMNHDTGEYELFSGMPMGKLIMKIGYTGCGKEQPVSTQVQTPGGPKRFGNLRVGDEVFSRSGKATKVIGIYPQGVKDVYRVTFRDGTSTRCGIDHLWKVCRPGKHKWVVKTTADLLNGNLSYGRGYNYRVPLCAPVEYRAVDHVIDPYLLGVLIGNGSLADHRIDFAVNENDYDEVVGRVAKSLTDGFALRKRDTGSCTHCYISDSEQSGTGGYLNRITSEIARLRLDVLSKSKFIPDEYLYDSYENRLAILNGLMDTDGSNSKNRTRFHTTSPRLADDVVSLVQSMGGVAILAVNDRTMEGRPVEYTVNVRVNFNPFFTSRKASTWSRSTKNAPARYIVSVAKEQVAEEQMCIMVEDPEHLYLTDSYIVTHNTTLCVQEAFALVSVHEQGSVFHFDLENAWSDERTADITGLSLEEVKRRYRRFTPVPLEKIYAFVKRIINTKLAMMADPNSEIWTDDPRTGERVPIPTVIIIDTVAALQSDDVMNGKEEMGSLLYESGAQAKANNAFAQRLAGMIGEPNITIYAVNHIRVDPGPSGGPPKPKRIQYLNMDETCPGGTGFPQYSDYFLKMAPSSSLTNARDEGFAIPGKVVRCTIVKSRLSYDGRQFELVLTDAGFDNAWTNLNFLKSQKALKGAGAHLFIEAPDGRTTQKFAQRNWKDLYEGDATFREIVDARIEEELLGLVPLPGTPDEAALMAPPDEAAPAV